MNSQDAIFSPGKPLFADEQRYQRVGRALTLIGCSKSKLYALIRGGRVKAIRLDGLTFIDMDSVARLFAECPQIVPEKHVVASTLSATQLGLEEPDRLEIACPYEAEPEFTISTADLEQLLMPRGDQDGADNDR